MSKPIDTTTLRDRITKASAAFEEANVYARGCFGQGRKKFEAAKREANELWGKYQALVLEHDALRWEAKQEEKR